jgi:hypothetical protein
MRIVGTLSRVVIVAVGLGFAIVSELVPREGWRPYVKATLTAPRVLSERKTGLYVPNVETVRLVQDERGWLRLAS